MNKNKKLSEVISSILEGYSVNEMSLLRLLNVFFLSEWYSALLRKNTITDLTWIRMSFGPASETLMEYLSKSNEFSIENIETTLDGTGISLSKKLNGVSDTLSLDDKAIIHIAVKHTKDLDFNQQDQFIHNLFPIVQTDVNQKIELISLSQKVS